MTSHDNVTDIVERLWLRQRTTNLGKSDGDLIREAADIIEKLQANIDIKADWIEKTINDMETQDDTIEALCKQLANAREAFGEIADAKWVGGVDAIQAFAREALKGQP